MGVAVGATHLDPAHAVTCIFTCFDTPRGGDGAEARPAAVSAEFDLRIEQCVAADDASILPCGKVIPELAGKGALGCRFSADVSSRIADAITQRIRCGLVVAFQVSDLTRRWWVANAKALPPATNVK